MSKRTQKQSAKRETQKIRFEQKIERKQNELQVFVMSGNNVYEVAATRWKGKHRQ